jgi:hypothetical protein
MEYLEKVRSQLLSLHQEPSQKSLSSRVIGTGRDHGSGSF